MIEDTIDFKEFISNVVSLRKLIVKDRYYRNSVEIQKQWLHSFILTHFNISAAYPETPYILKELAKVIDPEVANAMFALASPAIYVKTRHTSGSFVQTWNVLDVDNAVADIFDFMNCFSRLFIAKLVCDFDTVDENRILIKQIGAVLEGNIAYSTIFNSAVCLYAPELVVPVYDEDAVVPAPVQTARLEVVEEFVESDEFEDEETAFNRMHPRSDA